MTEIAVDEADVLPSHWKRQKHQIIGAAFFVLVVALIGSILYSTLSWMWDDQRLPLSKIILQGDLQYVTADDVQHAFGSITHIGTFMSQDVSVLQESVEALPWVAHASIRKQWPDTVKVFITEHRAAAIWNGNALLNQDGMVFDGDVAQLNEEIVKLYGPVATGVEVLKKYREMNPEFSKLGLSISSLVLNDRRAWQIILDNGIRLELGKESLDERVARFFSLYRQLGSKADKVSYVDLRYDTGAAVGWFPEQESE
ncbi:cell division protein FtsQ/DivIB [Vibrio vulnificus]|uniref:Cell division protein FtsQ n=1 Tax=Vibrio vulnificus TaxID=672 RepID=A0A2S3R5D8_VIBVL|nr:cell division protein FtsQ/DivIB [Vibrio vulnificus]ELP6756985.1 cell division protein FtsQ/DivIB [Vibrio vulnificus]MDK2620694.1 cell division protein FtsQ/DivIB [Vibrio vulnificus]POB48928.1 cell division protein FtsQ [Vibrio vulnificus]RAH25302.1 cell division protein FtsQ [Vibrio vulnificus]HDY7706034.1 cell division protein FtsQ/DivIB [Vibrio vulnificus]